MLVRPIISVTAFLVAWDFFLIYIKATPPYSESPLICVISISIVCYAQVNIKGR